MKLVTQRIKVTWVHFESCGSISYQLLTQKGKNTLSNLGTFVTLVHCSYTAQKMKFSVKDFFNKCDQICSFLRIWSHLLKKPLMENFIFCAVLMLDFFHEFKMAWVLSVPIIGLHIINFNLL